MTRIFPLLVVCLFVARSADAQYIVIRTGENVDKVLSQPLQSGKLVFALPSGEKIAIPVEYVNLQLTRTVSTGQAHEHHRELHPAKPFVPVRGPGSEVTPVEPTPTTTPLQKAAIVGLMVLVVLAIVLKVIWDLS